MGPDPIQLVEIRVSYRFIEGHNRVVQGITGFLSAYYRETPEFRVRRHYDELETGMHVWLCEVPSTMRIQTLLKRLTIDLPPSRVTVRTHPESGITRQVLDLKIVSSEEEPPTYWIEFRMTPFEGKIYNWSLV